MQQRPIQQQLEIKLLGQFEVRYPGKEPIDDQNWAAGPLAKALLKLLVLSSGLGADAAWDLIESYSIGTELPPGKRIADIKNKLKTYLRSELRFELDWQRGIVAITDPSKLSADVAEYKALVAKGMGESDPRITLEQADALYTGDLLGTEPFLTEFRNSLIGRRSRALWILAQAYSRHDQQVLALETMERLLAHDPCHMDAAPALIAAYGRVGSKSEALRVYNQHKDCLAKLDKPASPGREVESALQEVLSGGMQLVAPQGSIQESHSTDASSGARPWPHPRGSSPTHRTTEYSDREPNEGEGLEAYFTDVEYLRDYFQEQLKVEKLSKRILVIHGVGGVGKTSLLRIFRYYAIRAGVPVALASGDEGKSVLEIAILARWARDLRGAGIELAAFAESYDRYKLLEEDKRRAQVGGHDEWLDSLNRSDLDLIRDPVQILTDDFVAGLKLADKTKRIVLILDTFERMRALDSWLGNLAHVLRSNVFLVIAGQVTPRWDDVWPDWFAVTEVQPLEPMTDDVAQALITRYYAVHRSDSPDPDQVRAIVRFARGLPMVLTSAVYTWVRYDMGEFQAVKPRVVADFVDL